MKSTYRTTLSIWEVLVSWPGTEGHVRTCDGGTSHLSLPHSLQVHTDDPFGARLRRPPLLGHIWKSNSEPLFAALCRCKRKAGRLRPQGLRKKTLTLLKTLSHILNPLPLSFLFFGSLTNCCEFPDGTTQESRISMLRVEEVVIGFRG